MIYGLRGYLLGTAGCGALLGMAFGGGLTWAVRIIAGGALGVEAMGFGDVTLMIMIGAFLGWQPALLAFAFAPFASIIFAVAQLLTSGEQKIAFGPYLCAGAMVVVIFWNGIWNYWAADGIFWSSLTTFSICQKSKRAV